MNREEKPPLVSAIIPAYNNESTIEQAIDSMLAQDLADREIIVVDDGSTDDTRRRIERYGDAVRPVFQRNGGSGAARNAGARIARGKYLAFLDGDDVAAPERLRSQVDALESRPEYGLAYGNICLMDAAGTRVRVRSGTGRYKTGKVTRELVIKNFVPGTTITVRRKLFEAIGGFDESLRSSEDWDMLVRVSHCCEFVYVDRPLVHVRIRFNSKSANLEEKEQAYNRVQSKIFKENNFGPDERRLRRLSSASLQLSLLSISLRYHRYSRALGYAVRGLFTSPTILLHYWREIGSRLTHWVP